MILRRLYWDYKGTAFLVRPLYDYYDSDFAIMIPSIFVLIIAVIVIVLAKFLVAITIVVARICIIN